MALLATRDGSCRVSQDNLPRQGPAFNYPEKEQDAQYVIEGAATP
jgi:hypothetical protein